MTSRLWENPQRWSTEDEIVFIGNLGVSRLPQRLSLLLAYQDGLAKRERWGDLDQPRIEDAVQKAVKQEIKRLADLRLYEQRTRVSVG